MRKIIPPHSLLWLFEPLEEDSGFVRRKLFSLEAAYLGGKLCLAIGDKKEPWNGLLVCTAREHHASLQREFPSLVPHAVLGKWLYLSQSHPEFETVAVEIAELAQKRDPRLGVQSQRRVKPAKEKRNTPRTTP